MSTETSSTTTNEANVAWATFNRERIAWGAGLIWGGVMAVLMALWLANKHDDVPPVITWILGTLGSVSISAGIRFLVKSFFQRRIPDGQTAEQIDQLKEKQTKSLAYALFGPAGFCLVLCVWLSFSKGLEAFGEGVGLGLFGLILAALGWWLPKTLEPDYSADRIFDNLSKHGDRIFYAFVALAVLCVGLFVWLVVVKRTGWRGFPEWFGFFALASAFITGGGWLRSRSGGKPTGDDVRRTIIYVGVFAGLFIVINTLIRAIIWRNDVFFRGMAGWQEEGGWRFWICAYSLLFGFAILFGCSILARHEARRNPRVRLAVYGYNTFLTSLLLLGILIVLNIVIYVRFPYTFNWTKTRGLYSLSPSSKHILANLKDETTIYVTMSQGGPIYKDLKVLLQNMQTETDKINVVEISPDRQKAAFEDLAKKYNEVTRGVLLVHGPESQAAKSTQRRTFIPAEDLEKRPNFHAKKKQTRVFIGEEAVMKDLQFLMDRKQKRKVYFLQGHGELDVTKSDVRERIGMTSAMDRHGAGELAKRLGEDNYELIGLRFKALPGANDDKVKVAKIDPETKKLEVPKDAFAVVIAGASSDLEPEALDALDRYISDRAGRMLVLLDVATNDISSRKMLTGNLKDFLKRHNVEIDESVVLGIPNRRGVRTIPTLLMVNVPFDADTMLGKQFSGQIFTLRTVRPVRAGSTGKGFSAEVLLQVEPRGKHELIWAEPNMIYASADSQTLGNLIINGKIRPQLRPISVGVTVRDDKQKPRIVVIGDTEFVSNDGLASSIHGFYYALIRSSLDWLVERPGIGIPPKTTDTFHLARVDKTKMVFYPGWIMVLVVVGMGTGIWMVRRRE